MLYFLSMRKKITIKPIKKNWKTIITSILIIPILVLKFTGDLFITLFRIIFKLFSKTYNFIISFSSQKLMLLIRAVKRPKKVKKAATVIKTVPIYDRKRPNLVYIFRKEFKKIKRRFQDMFSFLNYFDSEQFISWLKIFLIKIKFFFLGALIVTLIFGAYEINNFMKALPKPNYLNSRDIPATTKIYDRNGKFLYEIYADENRVPVKLTDVPLIVRQATISIEDREFYQHSGFSLRAIARALVNNFYYDDKRQGGSTITQQLIRSALLTPDRTITRKLKEIFLSIWAEQIYSKDQILEMYLNQVPYGGTAWGIEAAAQTYFGKSIKNVDLAEAALLAGLPAAPSIYSPFGARPDLSKKRQEEVLDKMAENNFLTPDETKLAKEEKLSYTTPHTAIAAPHFVMYVKELLEQRFGQRLVQEGGLRVTTTLDLDIQEAAQKIVSQNLAALRPLNVNNGAVLITNPQNGEILAMVGSENYFDIERQGNFNVALSIRPPGSSIKIVTYTAALKDGFTAATLLDDSPVVYRIAGQSSYIPVNYDGKYHGTVPLRTAFASSFNIPAVKTLEKIGIKNMLDQARLMGITSWNDSTSYGLSITLGGAGVTMLDMARVYGTIANLGIRNELNPILKIMDFRGNALPSPIENKEIMATSPGVAFIITSILSDNRARIPAFGEHSLLEIKDKTVAVKTGTSDSKRDNWTIGFTPDYLVTVWVGNNDNSPMDPRLSSGVTGAAPIWHDIMTTLLTDKQDKPFTPTADVVGMNCYNRTEYFLKGTQPRGGCPKYSTISPTPSPTPKK